MLNLTSAQFAEPAAGAPVTEREQALLNAANITESGENVDDEMGYHVGAVLLVIVPPVPGPDPACTLQGYPTCSYSKQNKLRLSFYNTEFT
jgi:hypothetical protein